MVSPTYTRSTLIEWVRNNAPDLRILRVNVDGKRECAARFTFKDVSYEFESAAVDPDLDIVVQCAEALRAVFRMPPLAGRSKARELETAVLAASFNGDEATAQDLTRQLVNERAGTSTQLYASTSFAKRVTW